MYLAQILWEFISYSSSKLVFLIHGWLSFKWQVGDTVLPLSSTPSFLGQSSLFTSSHWKKKPYMLVNSLKWNHTSSRIPLVRLITRCLLDAGFSRSVTQSCLTFVTSWIVASPQAPVHGGSPARILEWVARFSSRGSS